MYILQIAVADEHGDIRIDERKTVKKHIVVLVAVVLLASAAACLREGGNPVLPTAVSSAALTVDSGFTSGAIDPSWGLYMTGEFSAFTMRWTEIDDAVYYEIRGSESPVTTENWYDAIPMATVQAPADTADVFVRVEVQEEPCIACGLCEQVCPMNAITVENGVAVIDYDLCTACGQCMDVCPTEAITGTRYGKNYFFGIRAFFGEDNPAADIAVTDGAWRLIYYNNHYTYNPTLSCGLCTAGDESACYILTDYADSTDVFCGYGCPVDAVWQDTEPVGAVPNMIYIDYDECINCGQCFMECWNYHGRVNPDPSSYTGMRSLKRRVVSANWVSDQPARP